MFSWVINFTYDMAQCRERVDSDLRKSFVSKLQIQNSKTDST